VNLCFLNGVFNNRFPLASPSETRECPEKESTSSTDKGPEEVDQEKRDGETWRRNVGHDFFAKRKRPQRKPEHTTAETEKSSRTTGNQQTSHPPPNSKFG
jgi:hypothetical protein